MTLVSRCALLLGFLLAGCERGQGPEVVVYASVDRSIAEPILDAFEESTRIRVLAVYDTEANKTTGLVNRLLAERAHPGADVYWSGEIAQTLQLADSGILAAFQPAGGRRELRFSAADGSWYGFAARARVLLLSPSVLSAAEASFTIEDLAKPEWRGRVAVADPHFGTTRSHLAVLLASWGEPRFTAWLAGLRTNEVRILPGNAQVRDAVVAGIVDVGLTDSDDAVQAVESGADVRILLARQSADVGTVFVPNTAALVRGGPNPAAAKLLLDFLLSQRVEAGLVEKAGVFFATRPDVGSSAMRDQVREGVPASYAALAAVQMPMLMLVEREWFAPQEPKR